MPNELRGNMQSLKFCVNKRFQLWVFNEFYKK